MSGFGEKLTFSTPKMLTEQSYGEFFKFKALASRILALFENYSLFVLGVSTGTSADSSLHTILFFRGGLTSKIASGYFYPHFVTLLMRYPVEYFGIDGKCQIFAKSGILAPTGRSNFASNCLTAYSCNRIRFLNVLMMRDAIITLKF